MYRKFNAFLVSLHHLPHWAESLFKQEPELAYSTHNFPISYREEKEAAWRDA